MNVTGTWTATTYFTNPTSGGHMPFVLQIQLSTSATVSFLAASTSVYADTNDCISGCLLYRTG